MCIRDRYKAHKEGKGQTIKAEPRVGTKRKAE